MGRPLFRVALRTLALAAILLSAASASANALVYLYLRPGGYSAEPENSWDDMGAISFGRLSIRFTRAACPSFSHPGIYVSCAGRWRDEWRIWLDPLTPAANYRLVLYHEIFHITDAAYRRRLNPLRAELRSINHWGGRWRDARWPTSFGPDWRGSPAERAADAAAWCAYIPRHEWETTDPGERFQQWPSYLWLPSRERFVATCHALLRHLRRLAAVEP